MKIYLLSTLLAALCPPQGGCVTQINVPPDSVAQGDGLRPSNERGSLEVQFAGIETQTGKIMLMLFDSAEAHDGGGDPVRAAAVAVAGSSAVAQFADLAPGTYAIKAFHDIDGDGALATNPFGLPIEPFAFSNNATPQGGPPAWEAARFSVEAGANTIRISIK